MIGNRAKEVRRYLDLSQGDVCAALGIKTSSYSAFETGKTFLAMDNFITFITKYNVNPSWMILGNGSPFIDETAKKSDEISLKNYHIGKTSANIVNEPHSQIETPMTAQERKEHYEMMQTIRDQQKLISEMHKQMMELIKDKQQQNVTAK